MGSLEKGRSVHPEVAFGALGAEEVTIAVSFLSAMALGCVPTAGPLYPRLPDSPVLAVAECATCPNN